jgi:probable phosphoglycerate mutase
VKLVLVRHLPTRWNLEARLQGRRDIPIEPLHDDARGNLLEVGAALKQLGPFDCVYTSPLCRAHQTAKAFGYANAIIEPLLSEISFGEWEGALREDFFAVHGEAWMHHPETLSFAEPMSALADRIRLFVEKNRIHERVLGFGHGAWIRAARAIHDTGNLSTMNQTSLGNSAVVTLEW